MRTLTVAAVVLAVVAFYFWIASAGNEPTPHYRYLAQGFLNGHLHLSVAPRSELLALPDPRDPDGNEPWRLHDASLYNGVYYLYFGPAPVLAAYLPWRALTGADLPDRIAAPAFAAAGYMFSVLLLLELLRRTRQRLSTPIQAAAAAALGLCTFVPFVLRRPAVYEVAILSGYAFFMAAAYAFARERYALAGIAFVLAAASRPHYALAAVVFWIALAVTRRRLASFTIPLIAGAAALLSYNYARFGDPVEFGINYMLGGAKHLQHLRYSLGHVLPGLYYFLLCPPKLLPEFPFFRLAPAGFPAPYYYFLEPVAGAFAVTPAIIATFFARGVARTLVLASLAVLCVLVLTGWTTQRYSVDFVPALLVAALTICWRWKRLAVVALVFGMVVNVAVSFTGYDDGLRERHPDTYYRIAGLFGAPRERALDISALVTFPERPPRRTEPLLTTGEPFAGNVVAVRYIDAETIRILSVKWGVGGVSSPPLSVQPGRAYDLRIVYSPDQHELSVRLDGSLVLTHAMVLFPTRADQVLVGQNRINPEVFGARFSGVIEQRAIP
ncbi:MAG TPA: hypothetical protein VFL57_02380 [Bryobacteraceae bacterium]|nr:hypothetical protein [Bryobacteraceae bacterium]